MRLEESNDTARLVPVVLSAGMLAVALPLFRARAVPVDATAESARVVVVEFVDLAALAAAVALEPADDVSARETAVVERASVLPAPAGLAAGAAGATGAVEALEGAMIAGAAVGTAAPRVGTFAGRAAAAVGIGGSSEPSARGAACAVGTTTGTTGGAALATGALARSDATAGAGFATSGCGAEVALS